MGTAEPQWSGRECQVEVGGRSVVEEGEEEANFRGLRQKEILFMIVLSRYKLSLVKKEVNRCTLILVVHIKICTSS